ncbi:MAG: hypothetical protein ACTS5I_16790, partial [Rhodanobacter sp.]
YQPLAADLTAIAALTSAADKALYATGAGTWGLADFTGFGRSIAGAIDAVAALTLLGAVIGADVQAFDARLADIAGATFAQGDILYFNGTNLVNLAPGSAGQVFTTGGAGANPSWETVSGGGGGDVSAASNFGTDNRLLRSDGTLKGVQASGITLDDSDRMIFGHTAGLSIGPTSLSPIQLHSTGNAASQSITRWSSDNVGAHFTLAKSRSGTIGSNTIAQNGDNIGVLNFAADDGTDLATVGARIGAYLDGTPGADDMPTKLLFFTVPDGSNALVERLRINAAGNVGIGNGVSQDDSVLTLNKAVANTNAYGFRNFSQIQSANTGAYISAQSVPSIVAASFTLSNLYHFLAEQGSLGAGAAVTNQYGFFAQSSLTGATNNYGFYGNIASGTNRWNFYAAGTADNFMAGRLGLGSLPANTALNVNINSSGSVAWGFRNTSTIQSETTNSYASIQSNPSTAVASFTLGSLFHFAANRGTSGAGSAITDQYGLEAIFTVRGAAV